MLVKHDQNWRTSQQGWNLSLANTVNTGTTFNTPSDARSNSHTWASRGMQGGMHGYGPLRQYGRGAGMDGLGHGCGCGGACGCDGHRGGDGGGLCGLILLAAAAYFVFFRDRGAAAYE